MVKGGKETMRMEMRTAYKRPAFQNNDSKSSQKKRHVSLCLSLKNEKV